MEVGRVSGLRFWREIRAKDQNTLVYLWRDCVYEIAFGNKSKKMQQRVSRARAKISGCSEQDLYLETLKTLCAMGVFTPIGILDEYLIYTFSINGEGEIGLYCRAAKGALAHYIKYYVLNEIVPRNEKDKITDDVIEKVVESLASSRKARFYIKIDQIISKVPQRRPE